MKGKSRILDLSIFFGPIKFFKESKLFYFFPTFFTKAVKEVKNLKVVKDTFVNISRNELGYIGLPTISAGEIFDDIVDTSIIIAFRGGVNNDEFGKLLEGIKRIKSYIFSKNFILEEAVLSSSKVAYLAILLKNNIYNIEFFNDKKDVIDMDITDDRFKKSFKSIKKFSPEGYYYWYKFLELYN